MASSVPSRGVAAFLPLPAFFGRRAGEAEQFSGASSFAAQAQGAALQLSTIGSDHVVSAIHKAAAVMAAVAVVGGSGVAIHQTGVKLPVKIPVLESATASKGPAKNDKGSGTTPRQAGPKQGFAKAGTGGAAAGETHQAPSPGSPAALTGPPATPRHRNAVALRRHAHGAERQRQDHSRGSRFFAHGLGDVHQRRRPPADRSRRRHRD